MVFTVLLMAMIVVGMTVAPHRQVSNAGGKLACRDPHDG